MVEFYDPDASHPGSSAAMQVEVESPPQPPAAAPWPIWEWVVLGLAIAAGAYTAWSELRRFGGGVLILVQFAYPLVIALVAAAVTSLLLRRVFRTHRLAVSAELERLRLEVRELTRAPGDTPD